jgi:hypothetical protein
MAAVSWSALEEIHRRAWQARQEAECEREISAALRRRAQDLEESHHALAAEASQVVRHSRRTAKRNLFGL